MLSTPKSKSELFLASSLRDGLEDNNIRQVTTLLKSKEADPNVLIPSYGISPFHLVIGNQSERFAEEVTKLFLRYGGNPNVKAVDGMTPVHVAAAWGRVKVLELLLANGGDPLCVDDDGRTPFHYAFDGSYYDAITVLGKYCVKNQDDDGEDYDSDNINDIKPKIEIKLEKILINRGNIIAEYVPSDRERSNNTLTSEDKENTNLDNTRKFFEIEYRSSSSRSSPVSENNAVLLDDNIKINSDNITMRRPRREPEKKSHAISPILSESDKFNFDSKNRNENEEKVLVGKIIRKLSTSFKKINERDHIKDNISKDTNKKFPSLIPQPKIYKNNLKCMKKKETIPSKILDTSIVSRSPNFQISISRLNKRKTPPSLNSNKFTTLKNRNLKLKTFSSSSSRSSSPPVLKSASSTPRRRLHRIHNRPIEKSTHKINLNSYKIQNLIHQTYSESEYDIPYISQDKRNYKMTAKRITNVARKLHDSDNEDYGHNMHSMNNKKLKIKSIQINRQLANKNSKKPDNKSTTNTIMRIQKIDSSNSPVSKTCQMITVEPAEKLKISKTPKKNKNIQPQPIKLISLKTEYCKCLLQSPGSSNPISMNSSCKGSLETEEEIKLHDEAQEIYETKDQTPPASVSNFDSEPSTSLEILKESSNSTEEFFDCQKVDNSNNLKQSTINFYTDKQEIYTKLKTERIYDSDSETFRTPMRSIISSTFSNESFVSVDEEYTYIDAEKNVAFLERRLRVIPILEDMDNVKHESTWLDQLAELSINSCAISSKQSSKLETNIISNNTLRNKLISLGEIPGPITHTTYNVYLKRLRKLQQKDLNTGLLVENSYNETRICKIPTTVLKTDWMSDITYYQNLEDQVFSEYEKPNSSKKYRGGLGKISFNYLLLDPRITKDLPRSGRNLSLNDRWKRFLEAIFYVGKGKATRPAAHLYDAFDIWTGKKQIDEPSEKIQRIISIWHEGRGVVCLHVFMNTMQEEAFTREAAMIDALGTNHLSNCSRGNYYGILSTMDTQEKRHLGKYLLYKAMEIFMFEGERQLFPRSIF
ncbi:uncharacterized protein [Chelonus insularis]|uniref:uncharacterized protein n=1 Tax=Chelonus insularis TaxID=460826 RepID=UPI00158F2750|nr:uncharacterized protein LOC118066515 [Chelonus insularis]XP_034938490.1 uncharacterized protein LOC118066515 [Chelonus insularis]